MSTALMMPQVSMESASEGPIVIFTTFGMTERTAALVDAYILRQRRQSPGAKISKGEAIRRLVISGLIREGLLADFEADDPPLT